MNMIYCFTGCGHCKKAKPEYATAAEAFKDDPRIELAAVDCTKHNAVCSAYSVKGFPTFKYFSYLKTVRDYDGGRTVSLELLRKSTISNTFSFDSRQISLNSYRIQMHPLRNQKQLGSAHTLDPTMCSLWPMTISMIKSRRTINYWWCSTRHVSHFYSKVSIWEANLKK